MRNTLWILVLVAGCAIDRPAAESSLEQGLLACDEGGCDNAATRLAESLFASAIGDGDPNCFTAHSAASRKTASCMHDHEDGSGELCSVVYDPSSGRVYSQGCQRWGAGQ